jgi:hypothetical protein
MESRDGKYGRQKIKGKAEFHASATDAFDIFGHLDRICDRVRGGADSIRADTQTVGYRNTGDSRLVYPRLAKASR